MHSFVHEIMLGTWRDSQGSLPTAIGLQAKESQEAGTAASTQKLRIPQEDVMKIAEINLKGKTNILNV